MHKIAQFALLHASANLMVGRFATREDIKVVNKHQGGQSAGGMVGQCGDGGLQVSNNSPPSAPFPISSSSLVWLHCALLPRPFRGESAGPLCFHHAGHQGER